MRRREFIQSAAPVTLAILPSLPQLCVVPDDVFKAELYRRFENLPAFLKSDGAGFNLATAVRLLSEANPMIVDLGWQGARLRKPEGE